MTFIIRPVTSLGHQEGRRVFRKGPKFFELCPICLNYVQNIFPGGAKNFLAGASSPPLVPGLFIIKSSFVQMLCWPFLDGLKSKCKCLFLQQPISTGVSSSHLNIWPKFRDVSSRRPKYQALEFLAERDSVVEQPYEEPCNFWDSLNVYSKL